MKLTHIPSQYICHVRCSLPCTVQCRLQTHAAVSNNLYWSRIQQCNMLPLSLHLILIDICLVSYVYAMSPYWKGCLTYNHFTLMPSIDFGISLKVMAYRTTSNEMSNAYPTGKSAGYRGDTTPPRIYANQWICRTDTAIGIYFSWKEEEYIGVFFIVQI